MLLAHAMAIPVTSTSLLAAPPFDSLDSRTPTARSAAMPLPLNNGGNETSIHTAPYFTDSYGNILMNVNVWGATQHTGPLTVPEGSDLPTVISIAGGPSKDANLEKIRINRVQPDNDGKMTYLVNLKTYVKSGDRSMLLDMQPNDTVIIPESKSIDPGLILGIIAVGASIYSLSR
jgi:hypothetical protein